MWSCLIPELYRNPRGVNSQLPQRALDYTEHPLCPCILTHTRPLLHASTHAPRTRPLCVLASPPLTKKCPFHEACTQPGTRPSAFPETRTPAAGHGAPLPTCIQETVRKPPKAACRIRSIFHVWPWEQGRRGGEEGASLPLLPPRSPAPAGAVASSDPVAAGGCCCCCSTEGIAGPRARGGRGEEEPGVLLPGIAACGTEQQALDGGRTEESPPAAAAWMGDQVSCCCCCSANISSSSSSTSSSCRFRCLSSSFPPLETCEVKGK